MAKTVATTGKVKGKKTRSTQRQTRSYTRIQIWKQLNTVAIVGLLLLLFYPPYFRGLFFASEMLPSQIATALLFGLVLAVKLHKRDLSFLSHPLDFAVLAYALGYVLSLPVAASMPDAVKGMLKAVDYLVIYWLVIELVNSRFLIRTALNVLYVSALGVAIVGIGAAAGYIHFPDAIVDGRIYSTLQYPNVTSAYLAAASLLGFAFWQGCSRFLYRLAYALGNFLLIAASLATLSKGGWIVLALGLVLFAAGLPWRRWPRFAYNAALATGASLIASRGLLAGPQGLLDVFWRWLLIGALVAALGELAATGAGLALRKITRDKMRYIKYAVIALVILGIGAGSMAAAVNPSQFERFLPAQFAQRLATFSLEDSSFVTRADFAATAWRIIKEHPVLGTGAGGWNALYHQYQDYQFFTTEVHNHFLQVWVEAGIFGFAAFLAIWAILGYTLFGMRRSLTGDEHWPIIWGTGVAALAMGAHSAIDFTLSLPSVCILLWALLGLVRGCHTLSRAGEPAAVVKGKKQRLKLLETGPVLRAAAGIIAVLVLLYFSATMYSAERSAIAGTAALKQKDAQRWVDCLERAARLDPFTASYRVNLAQALLPNASDKEETASLKLRLLVQQLDEAERMEPNSVKVQGAVCSLYFSIGRFDKAQNVAERLVTINPWDKNNYEARGRTSVYQGLYLLERKEENQAETYLVRAFDLPAAVEKQAGAVPPDRLQFWQGSQLEVTPAMELAVGQAAFLKGDYAKAADYLKAAYANEQLKSQAVSWLAATFKAMKDENQLAPLLTELNATGTVTSEEYKRLLSVKGL
jgi:O-antigen ligase/tetratricopeptide (TPR) repeat protein